MNEVKRPAAKRLVRIALMAALLCVCSFLTVPFAVPFTMQTFGVFCALLLLGGKDGTAAILLYILMGAAGLPVFSGFRGGIGHLLGPTGGYVIGFLLSGAVFRLLEKQGERHRAVRWASLLLGLAACYLSGTVWFTAVSAGKGNRIGFAAAMGSCVLPYVIPDLLKAALAVYTAERIRNRIPR